MGDPLAQEDADRFSRSCPSSSPSCCSACWRRWTTPSAIRCGVTGADKLITTNKYSITLSLPFADVQQIRAVPGVAEVTWITWFGGYYQESKNFVFALPVDTDTYFNLHMGEFVVSDAAMRAFKDTRTGALVNAALMKKFGWKVGDKVPLHSTIWTQKDGSLDWTFDIVGSFDAKDQTQQSQQAQTLLFHYEDFRRGPQLRQGHRRLVRGAGLGSFAVRERCPPDRCAVRQLVG